MEAVALEREHDVDGEGAPSTRGPASAPSLVTWPINTTAAPVDFAAAASSAAHSRTWATEPGADSTRSVRSVCTESTSTSDGCVSRHGSAIASTLVSASTTSASGSAGRRSARSRICSGLSSPAT